jgi:hypothetical protein
MRYLKDMSLTEKAEAFDTVFRQCLRIDNDPGEEGNDLDELLTEALGLEGDDAELMILADGLTVELKKIVDARAAILSGDKDELHEFCREIADDPDSLLLEPKELVELSLFKWENNQWENNQWSLGSGRGHCPLCARYRHQDPMRRACDTIRWVCDDNCPLAATPCHSDEMLTALGRGDKLHIVENLRTAKARLLVTKTYTPNEVGILLAKESAMQNANVAFNFQNGSLIDVVVKER